MKNRSRAIAIGAQENIFYLFSLKSRAALESQIESGGDLKPIDAVGSLHITMYDCADE